MNRFPYQVSLALVGVVAIVAVVRPASALEREEISQRAREFTVRIEGEEQGSGVIIERDGNTYTVLTNWHVVDTRGSYMVVTNDRKQHQVSYDSIRYLPGADLAILRFTSSQDYSIAERGNSAQITGGSEIYLGGWAAPFPGVPESSYTFWAADVVSRLERSEKGYSILHDNPGTPGTSGGPILDTEARLVGINGRSVVNGNTGGAFGQGIPLHIFLNAGDNLALPPVVAPPPDFIALGKRRANEGDYQGAIAEYNRAISQGIASYDAYHERGKAYYEMENYEAALADFIQVIQLNPNFARSYIGRGVVYYELGETEKAIADYNQAIRLEPNHATAYNNRGVYYRDLGELAEAITDFNQAIRLDPNYAYAYVNRGIAYNYLGEIENAHADFEQAIHSDPNNAVIYRNRGVFHMGLGETRKAIADYDQAIHLDPSYAIAYTDRGKAYHKLGEMEKAIADHSQAIYLDPNYSIAYTNRGNVYHGLGEKEKAIADYNQTIRLDPNYAIAYYNRGLTYHELGEIGKAREDFQRAANLFQQQGDTELYRRTLDSLRKLPFNSNIWRRLWWRR